MLQSYLKQEEERADWQEESNFLISGFLCKTIFITKANLPWAAEDFFSSVVVLLGRKHKTILENKTFSKFSALLPGLDEVGEEILHGEDSEP